MVPDIFGGSYSRILEKQTDSDTSEDLEESRSLKLPVDRSFPAFISSRNEDGANIKIDSSFEAGSRRYWLQGKDIAIAKSPKRGNIYKLCLWMLEEHNCLILTSENVPELRYRKHAQN